MPRKTEMPEDYKSRYLARSRYEQAVVKNLKPMLGPHGDNETASQFLNGAVEKRAKLFGDDVSRNAPTAGDLLARAMNYVPPAPEPKPARREPGVLDRVKEAAGVARDLVETVVGGYADAATLKPEDLSNLSGAADVARQAKALGISAEGTGTLVNGKFVDAATGKSRAITEADRREMESFKREIGLRQASKGGNARGESKASEVPPKPKYGLRPDGTPKGSGWLGELKLPGGGVATEYSVGVNIGGKEVDIPSLVPTLTKDEVADMVTNVIPNRAPVPEPVLLKAVAHAKERLAKRESVWAPEGTNSVSSVRQAAKAGDAGASSSSGVPSGHNPTLDGYGGPRIVINPSTFKNEKDALCVAFDEAFRILMEANGFDPVAEPTEKQREFFTDTAYNDDERMLRRTILARICTFDTSVSDPTDEQLQEAVEFLDTVMEIGAPQNEWEQRSVQRIRDAIARTVGQPRAPEEAPA